MFDYLLKPITICFGIFVTIVVIPMIYLAKMDYDMQMHCEDAIHEFVDKSRSTGYISADAYLELTRKMGETGHLYTLVIKHESYNTYPKLDESGREIAGEYTEGYNAYYNNEILAALFPDDPNEPFGEWEMKNGDYLKVNFEQKDDTNRFGFFHLKSIRGSYGGFVGSRAEE